MTLKYVTGNMFDVDVDIRINTINCVGAMGKGVALQFKRMYPKLYSDYRVECRRGRITTGKMYIWRGANNVHVVNFPTKDDWHKKSEYSFIEGGLVALRNYLRTLGQVSVAMPPIGCGNGGLSWDRIKRMINKHLSGLEATIYVFEPK